MENYFESLKNAVQEPEQPNTHPIESSGMATLTVKVDIDCKIFCDGDFLDLFEANKVKKVTIPTGQHLMTIESEHFEGVSEDQVVDAAESGKNYLLLVNDLKLKEKAIIQKAEEEKRKAEEEAKCKAEEEEERRRKELLREPYAALSNDNKTLTFYFDEQKTQRKGMGIGPFSPFVNGFFYEDKTPEWYKNREDIKKVVFDSSFSLCNRIISTAYWFIDLQSLMSIKGISFLNTNNITNMRRMFEGCSSLQELDLSNFNTNNVTDMSFMFCGCSSLRELDLSNFNTENVTNMECMFDGCSSLQELDLSNFNTNNVTDMSFMFNGCSSLRELVLSSFDTENVTNMRNMFCGCSSLQELDLSSFNINNVTDMIYMFNGCSSLHELDLSSFNTENVTNLDSMFEGCSSLGEIGILMASNKDLRELSL